MDWFTADPHLGHGNIIKYCRRDLFLSAREIQTLDSGEDFRVHPETVNVMDERLIIEINKVVHPDDTLRIVGDFCFGGKHDKLAQVKSRAQHYREQIDCKHVHLVFGNHDKKLRKCALGSMFTTACDKDVIWVQKERIVLDHEAHAIWDCRHHGAWHLYGHSHAMAEPWLDKIMPGRFSMDVGVDWVFKLFGSYRPISFDEIRDIMKSRSGFGLRKKDG